MVLSVFAASLLAFTAAGAVARLLAGPHLFKNLAGRASAVLFVTLTWITQFLPRWTYEHDRGWLRHPSIYYHNSLLGVLVHLLLNLVSYAILLVIVDTFATLGDRWMTRRLAAKHPPHFEAQA